MPSVLIKVACDFVVNSNHVIAESVSITFNLSTKHCGRPHPSAPFLIKPEYVALPSRALLHWGFCKETQVGSAFNYTISKPVTQLDMVLLVTVCNALTDVLHFIQ
jgi:hypothetical protein